MPTIVADVTAMKFGVMMWQMVGHQGRCYSLFAEQWQMLWPCGSWNSHFRLDDLLQLEVEVGLMIYLSVKLK